MKRRKKADEKNTRAKLPNSKSRLAHAISCTISARRLPHRLSFSSSCFRLCMCVLFFFCFSLCLFRIKCHSCCIACLNAFLFRAGLDTYESSEVVSDQMETTQQQDNNHSFYFESKPVCVLLVMFPHISCGLKSGPKNERIRHPNDAIQETAKAYLFCSLRYRFQ